MRKKVTFSIDEQAEKERHVFWDMQGKRFDPMEDGEREISYRSLTVVHLYKISGEGLDGWCEKAGINARGGTSRAAADAIAGARASGATSGPALRRPPGRVPEPHDALPR